MCYLDGQTYDESQQGSTCKQPNEAILSHNPAHHAEGGGGDPREH